MLLDNCALARIPAAVVESFRGETDAGKITSLKEEVDEFNDKYSHIAAPSTATAAATPAASGGSPAGHSPARTHCRPSFSDAERPLDVRRTVLPSGVLAISEFDSSKEFLELSSFFGGKVSLILF